VLALHFDADHTLAQLDLVGRRRLAETLLGQPLTEVGLDELDIFTWRGSWSGNGA
jgi:hypothetical protein